MNIGVVLSELYSKATVSDKKLIEEYIESKKSSDASYNTLYSVIKDIIKNN